MTEYRSSAIHEGKRNYGLGSWVYALLGLWSLLTGMTVFPEVCAYTAILAIIMGGLSVRSAHKAGRNAGKYFGIAVTVLGILEWITCFM